jgi:hypothetical protein
MHACGGIPEVLVERRERRLQDVGVQPARQLLRGALPHPERMQRLRKRHPQHATAAAALATATTTATATATSTTVVELARLAALGDDRRHLTAK